MQIGRFIDGPLIGVDYRRPTMEGVTDTDGAFQFCDGERISLSIGRLQLGATEAKAQITSVDLVSISDDYP